MKGTFMTKPDPFAEFVAAREAAGQLIEFLPRPKAAHLLRRFLDGQMATNGLFGLPSQPRSGTHPSAGTGVAGVREVADSYRQKGWTQLADELDAFAAEGEALLNT
jgi:hypothetical protein